MFEESGNIGQTAKAKDNINFCVGEGQIQQQQPSHDCRYDPPYNEEHRNSNIHTSSIFEGRNGDPSLEEMIKIKKKATPTQQQTQIHQLMQAFKAYTQKHQVHEVDQINPKLSENKSASSRVKQSFEQFIFYKLKEKTILFLKITPTRDKKCNITVFNLLGQVLQYFPNIYETKKIGKIIKFSTNNPLAQIIIVEQVEKQESLLSYLSLPEENAFLCCFFPFLKKQSAGSLMIQTRKEIYRKITPFKQGILMIFTQGMLLLQNKLLDGILNTILKINAEQKQFLLDLRGQKPSQQIIIAFDSMAINLWRKQNLQGANLTNKIFQFFKMEEEDKEMLQVKEPSDIHTPKRLKLAKNCCLCKINRPDSKRPKRTYFVCSSCSANRDPMYLCKNCFRTHRTPLNQTSGSPPRDYHQGITTINQIGNDPRRTETLLASLDKSCEEYLSKVVELIEQRGFQSAEYYLQHLLNLSISKTTAFLKKAQEPQIDTIKHQP